MHDETDFAIPSLGVPLSFSQHYNSANTVADAANRGYFRCGDRGAGQQEVCHAA